MKETEEIQRLTTAIIALTSTINEKMSIRAQSTTPAPTRLDRYLTVEQLAEHLKTSDGTIKKWMRRRVLPYIKVGRVVRFKLSDVEASLDQFCIKAVEM